MLQTPLQWLEICRFALGKVFFSFLLSASHSFLHYLFHFLLPLIAASLAAQSGLFQEALDLLNFLFLWDAISAIRNEASAEYNKRSIHQDVSKAGYLCLWNYATAPFVIDMPFSG